MSWGSSSMLQRLQETPDPGHAGIVLYLEDGPFGLVEVLQGGLAYFGVPLHRAEHVADEDLLVRPDALLPEEHGAGRVEPHGDGDGQEER